MGLKGRAAALVYGVIVSLGYLSDSAFASDGLKVVHQTKPFLKSIKETPYNFEYLVEGLSSIHSIRFTKVWNNYYEPFWNRLNLQKGLSDPIKRLKKVSELSPLEFGVLAHEAFHPFFRNKIKSDPKYKTYKKFMARMADFHYRNHPRKKREVALEEAYASFLDSLLSSHKTIDKILKDGNKRAACQGAVELAERFWNTAWNTETKGYYYRDSISEYWSDQFKGLGVLFTKGHKAYRRYLNRDKTVYVRESIMEIDKKWIAKHILEDKVKRSWKETFSNYACVKKHSEVELAKAY